MFERKFCSGDFLIRSGACVKNTPEQEAQNDRSKYEI